MPCRPLRPYDITQNRTHDGWTYRTLNNEPRCAVGTSTMASDGSAKKALMIRVDRRLNSTDVEDALTDFIVPHVVRPSLVGPTRRAGIEREPWSARSGKSSKATIARKALPASTILPKHPGKTPPGADLRLRQFGLSNASASHAEMIFSSKQSGECFTASPHHARSPEAQRTGGWVSLDLRCYERPVRCKLLRRIIPVATTAFMDRAISIRCGSASPVRPATRSLLERCIKVRSVGQKGQSGRQVSMSIERALRPFSSVCG